MIAAITVRQPWASMIADGVKRIECRSWPCPMAACGQPLAIHSAAGSRGIQPAADVDPTYVERHAAGQLPLGKILGVTRILSCVRITQRQDGAFRWEGSRWSPAVGLEHEQEGLWFAEDAPYCNLSVGTYLWSLESPIVFNTPIKAKGRQRLWYCRDAEIVAGARWGRGERYDGTKSPRQLDLYADVVAAFERGEGRR